MSLWAQPFHISIETPGQDKAFSELNHHIAGFFLLAIGIFAGLGNVRRLSFLGKVWPFLFILPGLYLAFMSDPEVWPMGTENWVQTFQSDPDARQHKIYSMLLLAMGILEFLRSRGRLGKFLAIWSFPALAVFGAVFLFFHEHSAAARPAEMMHGMPGILHNMPGKEQGSHMMTETMIKIKREHFWFSIVGVAVAFFKFLSDGNFWKRPFVPFLWPAFISLLGVLLTFYVE